MVTMKDVAKRARVSFTTVSHVINRTRRVNDDTAVRVREAIAELGYLPSEVARALKSNRTRIIGMIVTSTGNPYFGEIVHGVERECFERGYSLILCNTDDVIDHLVAYLKTLYAKRIDALVVMTSNASPEFFTRLSQTRRVPFVAIDAADGMVPSVFKDNSRLGAELVADLFAARGFRRIGCIAGPLQHPRTIERIEGFRRGLARHGLDLADERFCASDFTMPGGQAAGTTLLSVPPDERPDAIFALNDLMAIGALHAADELGLRVPDEISIVGYDDIEFAAYTRPPLTTVRQPAAEIGAAAAKALLDHLDEGTDLPVNRSLRPELVIRESVAGPAR